MKYFYLIFLYMLISACSGSSENGSENKHTINSNIDSQNIVINNKKEPIIINLDISDVMTDKEIEEYYSKNNKSSINYIYINDNYSPSINNNNSIIITIDEKDNISLVEPEPQTELFIDTTNPIINTNTNITLDIE